MKGMKLGLRVIMRIEKGKAPGVSLSMQRKIVVSELY